MALDTRGLASGFAQGFGLMNQYQQQERQNERQDKQDAMQAEQYEMQKEQMANQQEQAARAQDMEDLQFTLGKIASGMEVDETEIELLRRNPKFWPALDPETNNSIEQAQSVIDPNTPVDANDPESLAALNQMFGAEINKGEGGQKRIVGMYPGTEDESVTFELEVIGEDGQRYEAPMTQGRSPGGDDDMVMQVPVERLVEQVQGMRVLRNAFSTPEAQQRASQTLQLIRGESNENWDLEEHPRLGMIQVNSVTGEVKPIRPGAGSPYDRSGSGGSSKPPSRIQEAQELVDRGVYPTFADAYEAVRARAGQQNGAAQNELKYYSGRLDGLNEALNDRATLAQLSDDEVNRMREERQAIQERLPDLESQAFGREAPGSSTPPPPEQQPAPKASTPQQQPEKETGLRPGPAESNDIQDSAASILEKYL